MWPHYADPRAGPFRVSFGLGKPCQSSNMPAPYSDDLRWRMIYQRLFYNRHYDEIASQLQGRIQGVASVDRATCQIFEIVIFSNLVYKDEAIVIYTYKRVPNLLNLNKYIFPSLHLTDIWFSTKSRNENVNISKDLRPCSHDPGINNCPATSHWPGILISSVYMNKASAGHAYK